MTRKKTNNGFRHLKVASVLQEVLSKIFASGKAFDADLIDNTFYITHISVSKDLRFATCHIDTYQNHTIDKVMNALLRSTKNIRYAVSKNITLRYIPELKFIHAPELSEVKIMKQ